MRIFLATTSLSEIRWASDAALINGVVATPTVIQTELPNADARDVIADIAKATSLPICASVPAIGAAEIYKGAKELGKVAEHLIIAVPFIEDAAPAIRRLAADGVTVAATLVYSAAQGILAAKAGASMVTIAIDALESVGQDATAVVRELRATFDHNATECDIAAAGPASSASFSACAAAGADIAILTPAALHSLLQHPLTDRGLDRFLGDISRRAKPRRAR
jgi:transaldolase